MIVNKSFKYNSFKHPKVHAWVEALEEREFSEAVRRLIEKDCGGDTFEPNPILEELRQIRSQIAGLRLSGPVTPQQEAELIEIEQSVEQVERQEIKSVNPTQLKSRYGL